jgi:3-isopropylmalate/(R)-2-methylmalate dehydratase large subunit
MNMPKTLFEKVWDNHVVIQETNAPALLYIDLHLVHEVTSPQAFMGLRQKGLTVRRPELTLATVDHSSPTKGLSLDLVDELAASQIYQFRENCQEFGLSLLDMDSDVRGIVHVVGPEQGRTQPGMTIVCGDSHTSTHGAFGALAFGIGTSEVEHVLATQCTLQYKPKTYRVEFEGVLQPGVTAKDMILALISEIGIGGGTGHVFEFTGSAVRSLNMESRMTLCNMSIEAGARAGMIAPDDVTYSYLQDKSNVPKGEAWETALESWQSLPTDPGAEYDKEIVIRASSLEPMVTYGTNPGMGVGVSGEVPDPRIEKDPSKRAALHKALKYMDITPNTKIEGQKIDTVFIGSCTNGRISDLRMAASILRDRKIAGGVRLLVVPGSELVRAQAEAEGIDKIVRDSGGEWRYAGCSMCIAMNGDQLQPGEYAVSTSNRNFEGRQGPGGRTILASPYTAAASAVTGTITDPREFLA